MEREILFKAKRVDTGDWIEGDLIHGHPHHHPNATIVNDGCIYTEVDPSTVCIYTGRFDLDKTKLFHNDSFLDQNGKEWVVSYSEVRCAFMISPKDREWQKSKYLGSVSVMRVTGNIHTSTLKRF